MKKFLEFIWVLISPAVEFVVGAMIGCLVMIWACTGFGVLIIFAPTILPTPEWVRWSVIVFDSLLLGLFIYAAIKKAYEKVYKN
jgi:threonine/homoserine/homoserine lactone efflux protein